jgi:uncharacterized protein
MKLVWSEGELDEGLRSYRAGDFFAAHEHWESVWLASKEPEKTFLQGLIQVAAAFHHLQRGNRRGTHSLLQRARLRLERYRGYLGGVDVTSFCKEIDEWLRVLEAGGAIKDRAYPELKHRGSIGSSAGRGRRPK